MLLRYISIVPVLIFGLAASGCSGSGPTSRDFLSAGRASEASFALVEITDETIGIVSAWHRPSLSAVFGDYRRPAVHRIGVGDSVQINIWEAGTGGIFAGQSLDRSATSTRPALIPEQVVSRDGMINVPYAGRIKVVGKTPSEIEDQIVQRLQGKSAQPQALVTLTRNLTNSVTVTGDVTTGARVPLNGGGDRLLDVITQAGGVRAAVHET